LREQYGERLVCVRYRYDETKKQRWKTIELIIEQSAWEPPQDRRRDETLVAIQVAAHEREVRRQVKAAGGKWNPKAVVWELPYGQVVTLGLTERVVSRTGVDKRDAHLLLDRSEYEYPSTNR
jgi:hypothetical protein